MRPLHVYCFKKLQLDSLKVNANGGAMAIGHPLGATRARCVVTLLYEMKLHEKDSRFDVVSMCIEDDQTKKVTRHVAENNSISTNGNRSDG
nr:3-ketoacyl-CoA thiolase 2, peroxisomal [Tanacetum cinerariifolium]